MPLSAHHIKDHQGCRRSDGRASKAPFIFMWALVRIEQVSARNSSHRRHYELPPLIGPQPQCLHQSRAYRIISLSSMYCGRGGLCATRKGHLTSSCCAAASVVEVRIAQPRSRLGTHDLGRLVPQVRLAEFGAFRLFQAGSRAESTASLLHKFVRQHSGHEGLFGPKDGRCGSVKVRPIRPGPEHRQVRAQRHR